MKSEDRIQQEIYVEFNNKYPNLRGCLFHCPNGGTRDKKEAKKLKYMGVYPGVSDLIFLFKGKCYLIELKNEIGVQSNSQKKWEATMKEQGFDYVIFRTSKDTLKYIDDIIINNEQINYE